MDEINVCHFNGHSLLYRFGQVEQSTPFSASNGLWVEQVPRNSPFLINKGRIAIIAIAKTSKAKVKPKTINIFSFD